jgi:hypothetical protein
MKHCLGSVLSNMFQYGRQELDNEIDKAIDFDKVRRKRHTRVITIGHIVCSRVQVLSRLFADSNLHII